MFEASVDGELYDANKWGDHYRPYGVDNPHKTTSKPTVTVSAEPSKSVEEISTPVPDKEEVTETATNDTEKSSAEDILAMIRSRKNASE
jgi:hypothetical protein